MKLRTGFSKIAVAVAMAGSAAWAMAAPVVIQNGSVLAGVSDVGTLGSNGNTPPGILFDPTGTGNYGINDFLTPGTPFEGFYVTGTTAAGGGYSQFSNNTGATSFASTSPVSLTGTSATWSATSLDGSLAITNLYSLTTVSGKSVIAISTTMTNLSTSALSGLNFLRTLDPDPDVNAFGSFFTNNLVLSGDQACGTGPQSGQTICIFTDSPLIHEAGVSAAWTTSPQDYLNGLDDGNGDFAIGIGFALGDLGAGQSLTVNYGYVLGASLDIVTGTTPEPGTLALAGLALAGAAASRRRKA